VARVLVTEEIADRGLDQLRAAGHHVEVRTGLTADDLLEAVGAVNALIIRSATQITAEVLAAAPDLVVVGRAGIGLDNVDVAAATERGVMVVNAPQSNVISAAEHTVAMLLAQARNIPQAHAALAAGKWERSKWSGVELHGKTLGVVGLGRVGALVAQRCLAFGMRLIAFDPFVSADRARQMSVELRSLEELVGESDFLTIHLPKTPDTIGLIGKDLLAKARPGLRIINTARGGIVDEVALAEALDAGIIAGAALDVFDTEPTTESPLFGRADVVVTPHLGASTAEAQDKAGITIAEQLELALAGEFVPYAVNVDAAEASETVRPFLPLAERLGRFFGSLTDAIPASIDVTFTGPIADYDTRILTLSALRGLFGGVLEEQVTFVNAPQIAAERGLEVNQSTSSTSHDYVNLIAIRGGGHSVAGTLTGTRLHPRLVLVDDHEVEVPPAPNMLVVRNEDRPGMLAAVTAALGEAGVNISDLALGRSPTGQAALIVAATDDVVPDEVVEVLAGTDGIIEVHRAGC